MYIEVLFLQGDDADKLLRDIDNYGSRRALQAIKDAYYKIDGNYRKCAQAPFGELDENYEDNDGFILSYNRSLRYVGLCIDRKVFKGIVTRSSDVYRHKL